MDMLDDGEMFGWSIFMIFMFNRAEEPYKHIRKAYLCIYAGVPATRGPLYVMPYRLEWDAVIFLNCFLCGYCIDTGMNRIDFRQVMRTYALVVDGWFFFSPIGYLDKLWHNNNFFFKG